MKALLFLLTMALGSQAFAISTSSYTNFPGGIGVGSESAGTFVVMTGVATVDQFIPFSQVKQVGGVLPVAVSSTVAGATEIYNCVMTGATNTTGLCLGPSDTAAFAVEFSVPDNYRSGGVLVVGAHTNVTIAASALSALATGYVNTFDAATATQAYVGTAVVNTTTYATQINKVALTNSALEAALSPGKKVTVKVTWAGTLAIKELGGFWFRYRPFGAMK